MNKFTKLFLGLVLFATLVLPNVSDASAPKFGSRGADVITLQKELISEGFSISAGPTGYFGAQTQAAFSARAVFKAKGATPGFSLSTSNIAPPRFPSATDTTVSTIKQTVSATDCAVGHKFSSKTGKSCLTQDQTSSSCTKGDSYDTASGVRCTNVPKSAAVSTTTVTLITPNGGETFIKGNYYTIQWNSTSSSTVSLILRNQTASTSHYINPAISGTSSYSWIVPTYISGGYYKVTVTDVEESSSSDSSDNSFFIAYTASDADVNNDGTVNGVDLGMVLSAWGSYNGQRAEDINEDGTINQADVTILNSMWGQVL